MSRWYDKQTEYQATVRTLKAVAQDVQTESLIVSALDAKEQLTTISRLCRLALTQIDDTESLYEVEKAANS